MAFSETLIMAAANAAPRAVEWLIRSAAGTDDRLGWSEAVSARTLRRVKEPRRIAVVSDTNIGDSVVLQGACAAFKRWLPNCETEYFYQRRAYPLLCCNPNVDRHHPVFVDADFTSKENRRAVREALRDRSYDLVLNLYPFLMNSDLAAAGCPVLVPYRLISRIVRAEHDSTAIAHVAYQLRRYAEGVARILARQPAGVAPTPDKFENCLYLAADIPERANAILRQAAVAPGSRLAFLNPDSSSRFSRIPFTVQAELLRGLLDLDHFDHVLVGPAFTFVETPDQLCAAWAAHPRHSKLIRLPQDIPIDVYAGLIDRADLFITSDTAQMHLAAARRLAPGANTAFRNRTTLVAIFGATNSRIYGYDSFADGYLDSNQDAPAKVFEGKPACRNLTCIHKTRKTCRTVECFNGVSAKHVLKWIRETMTEGPRLATGNENHATAASSRSAATANPVADRTTGPVIVVSGLPRSGTSLMMQMLEAGGVPIATDGRRTPDADNPRGYYELERVKNLHQDSSWLAGCRGQAVKIISMLLPALPPDHEYRIIFMERGLPEILASQRKMLQRRGEASDATNDAELAASYERHLAAIKRDLAGQRNIRTLYVSYQSLVASAHETATRIADFLDRKMDIGKMVQSVDATLYRNRARNREPAGQTSPELRPSQ